MLRRVIKVGGSCLSHPQFAANLRQGLASTTVASAGKTQDLCVIGGGAAIDAMRHLDTLHTLDRRAMHWRCVRLLRASFEIAAELLPDWETVSTPAQCSELLDTPPRAGRWWIAVDTFYEPSRSELSGLPEAWETTTDAIAAFLTRRARADELLLFKSCPVPTQDPAKLAQLGIVDPAFPDAIATRPFRVVQLPSAPGT